MSHEKLFGVKEGKLYVRSPPTSANDNWMASAKEIGSGAWGAFSHLFFHPNGTLYGVMNGKLYKGPPPSGSSSDDWIAKATNIGKGAWDSFKFLFFDKIGVLYDEWSAFQFLFFDPQRTLYGVKDGTFYKWSSPVSTDDKWLESSVVIGENEKKWDKFIHLFFIVMSSRKFYGVIYGNLYANTPPSHAHSCWMASASEIGKTGWEDFRHLFFHPDGTLYGVLHDKFYKGRPPSGSSSEDWIANAELIGKSGWNSFKLLFFDPDGMLYGVEGDKL
ncbi:unnamed protein product [Porites evermanni]|uniref:Tachylectin 2 domain-containing protein n=1 Tax=Porites evermanni TaxID=104178 RepID=A0ABN8RX33_9CNID|nr:unnamed protein product [Porites evermanni]